MKKQIISYRIDPIILEEIKSQGSITDFLDKAIRYRLNWLAGIKREKDLIDDLLLINEQKSKFF